MNVLTSPRFSVALASYNGERFILEQLESIASQSLVPCEVVVCDDASTDGTVEIIREFARRAPFKVNLLQNEANQGYGETFLRAFGATAGEYVAFCDQDDVWLPNKLERYAAVLHVHPDVAFLSHSAQQVDEELRPLQHLMPEHRSFAVVPPFGGRPMGVYVGFSCCIRRALLSSVPADERPENQNRPGTKQAHDQFAYHVANVYGHTALLPDILTLYRRHNATVTGGEGGVYDMGLRARSLQQLSGKAEDYRGLAAVALQHSRYYSGILEARHRVEAPNAEFRTRHAVEYFNMIARAFAARAEIYDADAGTRRRVRSLVRSANSGGYFGGDLGRGFGMGPLLKDVARVLLPW